MVTPTAGEPLAESGLTWLAVLAVGVLFVTMQVTLSTYGSLGPLLAIVLLCLGILVVLLVYDARRLDARRRADRCGSVRSGRRSSGPERCWCRSPG